MISISPRRGLTYRATPLPRPLRVKRFRCWKNASVRCSFRGCQGMLSSLPDLRRGRRPLLMKLSGLLKKLFGARRREARAGGENRADSPGDGGESASGKPDPFDDEDESFDVEEDVDPFNPFPAPIERFGFAAR